MFASNLGIQPHDCDEGPLEPSRIRPILYNVQNKAGGFSSHQTITDVTLTIWSMGTFLQLVDSRNNSVGRKYW